MATWPTDEFLTREVCREQVCNNSPFALLKVSDLAVAVRPTAPLGLADHDETRNGNLRGATITLKVRPTHPPEYTTTRQFIIVMLFSYFRRCCWRGAHVYLCYLVDDAASHLPGNGGPHHSTCIWSRWVRMKSDGTSSTRWRVFPESTSFPRWRGV